VLSQCIDFLKNSNFQQDNWIEWFSQVDVLAALAHSNANDYRAVLEALRNSGHPILSLYAQLETTLPQSPDWVTPP
jgi:hypothetical protein